MKLSNKNGKLPILMLIVAVVVLALIGTGVMLFLGKGKGDEKGKGKEKEKAHVAETLVSLGEFVVNLNDTSQPHYLKIEVTLGVVMEGEHAAGGGGGHGSKGPDPTTIMLRDAVISTAAKFSFNQLLSNEGKDDLKKQIKEAVEKTPAHMKVHSVYFTSFAMQ